MAQYFLAWHVKPSDGKNVDFLDGLRGLAVLMVVVGHLFYINPTSSPTVLYLGALIGTGWMGVGLFFTLSGFLVSLPFWKHKKAGNHSVLPPNYIRRRFAKIYPPLALMVLVFTPIYIVANHDPSYLKPAVQWLFCQPVFFPVDGRFNPVLWTLTVEIQFYLTLPMAMWLARKLSLAQAVCIVPLTLFLMAELANQLFIAHGIIRSLYPTIFTPLFFGLNMFVLGLLISGLFVMGKMTAHVARLGWVGFALFVIAAPITAHLSLIEPYTSTASQCSIVTEHIAFACMLCFVGDPHCLGARLLSNALLRWFGIVSYEWYLFHQAIFFWFRQAIGHANGSAATYALIVGGSFVTGLLLAALCYRFYSLPILMYCRQHEPRSA